MSSPSEQVLPPAQDTHVRFGSAASVLYWMTIFGCSEFTLRNAAAATESTAVEHLRAYFNLKAGQ